MTLHDPRTGDWEMGEMVSVLRAVIWVPNDDDAERWIRLCLDWCEHHHAEVVAVVRVSDDDAPERKWEEVRRISRDGGFDYLVVADRAHLPLARRPRVVVVAEEPPPRKRPGRRPRLLDDSSECRQ